GDGGRRAHAPDGAFPRRQRLELWRVERCAGHRLAATSGLTLSSQRLAQSGGAQRLARNGADHRAHLSHVSPLGGRADCRGSSIDQKMRSTMRSFLLACAFTSLALAQKPTSKETRMSAKYPATRSEGTKDTLFGTVVEDPYRWLEDAKNPE